MMESESVASSRSSKPWFETRIGRLVIIVGLTGLFALVFWLARKSRQMVAEPSELEIAEQYLSFGEVWEDEDFIWPIEITNVGKEEVSIIGFDHSCTCAHIIPSHLTIPASGRATAKIHLYLVNDKSDQKVREFETIIRARNNKSVYPIGEWKFSGKVRKHFMLSASFLQFEGILTEGKPFVSKAVQIAPEVPIKQFVVACDQKIVSGTIAGRKEKKRNV